MNIFEIIKYNIINSVIKPLEANLSKLNVEDEYMEKLDGLHINFENSKKWKGIVLHHSASIDGKINDWKGIREYHTSWRYEDNIITEDQAKKLLEEGIQGVVAPWRDVGYHFGIEQENDEYVYKIGRSLSLSGAACVGYNNTHIQLCTVGDYDNECLNEKQLEMIINLLKYLKQQIVSIDLQNELLGHYESFIELGLAKTKEEAWKKYKTCPGKLFLLDRIKNEFKI